MSPRTKNFTVRGMFRIYELGISMNNDVQRAIQGSYVSVCFASHDLRKKVPVDPGGCVGVVMLNVQLCQTMSMIGQV